MNAPPPSPEDCGSTTLRISCTAIAASAALPPACKISRPASTATGLAAEIMKDFAVATWPTRDPVAASGEAVRSWAAAGAPMAASAATTAMMQARRTSLDVTNMPSQSLWCWSGPDVVRLFKWQGNPVDALGKTGGACILCSLSRTLYNALAHMWLNSHSTEQTRDFKALITDPWVASGLRPGQNHDGSSEA